MEIVDGQVRHRASTWLGSLAESLTGQAADVAGGHVTVVARLDGTDSRLTATSAGAARCDDVQDAVGDGPRSFALDSGHEAVVDDVAACGRWPEWVGTCREVGVEAAAVVVGRHEHARVALSVYRSTAGPWSPRVLRSLSGLAEAIALLALAAVEVEQVTRTTQDSLAALRARAVIDQALGVIMAQNRCGADQAFTILKTASMHRDAKLRAVAAEVVTGVSGQPPRVPEFQPRIAAVERPAARPRPADRPASRPA